MWLFLLFISVPLIEIALFVKVGGWLTLWPTLAIVLGTGVIGTWLVRLQGIKVMQDLRTSLRDMRDPLSPLAHGAMILLAGVLLITPGFFTDAVGFALLVPAVRRWAIRAIMARVKVVNVAAGQAKPRDDTIDADYIDVTNPRRSDQRPSGWTEH